MNNNVNDTIDGLDFSDLSRMFSLVSRVPKGLEELRDRFESHVHSQGLAAVEKCGEVAMSVSGNCHSRYINYCMTGRAIWGNIQLKGGPTKA